MNMLPVLNKIFIDQVIDHYIKKYQTLFFDLTFLFEITKSKLEIRRISSPDPIEDLIIGFREYFSRSLLILPIKHKKQIVDPSEKLYKFFLFLYVFGIVLDRCSEHDKLHLLKEFSIKCRKNPNPSGTIQKIRSFYHELKTIFFFLYFRYKIDHLPEREKKQFPNISPSDAVLSHIETRDIINLQCKSISLQIGHPITSNAASLFWNLLRDDQQLYNNLYPLDCDFSIEFTFDNPLDQKGYTANMLYDDIKHNNSRVKLSRFPGINRINSDEDRKQKRLMAFIAPIPSNHHHIIILHSLHRNEMETLLQKTIKEKIKRQQEQREDNNPIIYSFELYGPQVDSDNWSSWIITSEDTLLKGEPHPAVTILSSNSWLVSWDKIITDFLKSKRPYNLS